MPVYVCDFDGTVAPFDIGEEFMLAFGCEGSEPVRRALDRWRKGEIGQRELIRVECEGLRLTAAEALAFVQRFEVDPAFAAFAATARGRGDHVSIASEGFEFYIEVLLHRAGLHGVPFTANRLRFESGRAFPEFPHAEGCGACGNCKGARVREARRHGAPVVFVGDGLSDRCGARAADHVIARGALLDWCRDTGIPARPFTTFADLSAA